MFLPGAYEGSTAPAGTVIDSTRSASMGTNNLCFIIAAATVTTERLVEKHELQWNSTVMRCCHLLEADD